MALTAKQGRFVEEYLVDLNATQAAIRAGYSERTARAMGAENLTKPDIQSAIQEAMGDRADRTEITADRVLTELSTIGFLDPADIAQINATAGPEMIPALPEHVRRAIVGWGWDKQGNFTLKLADKLSALEKIGKHLGMFRERVEHSGPNGEPIKTEDVTPRDRIAGQLARLATRRDQSGDTGEPNG